jgi:hypothetical protein
MRYHYLEGVTNKKERKPKKILAFFIVVLVIGSYVGLNFAAPAMPLTPPDATAKKLLATKPADKFNRLYIPQVNIDVLIEDGESGNGPHSAWHRAPENGNPKTGGNFALSASRFSFGFTPLDTKQRSPFYFMDKLKSGDEVYVDWEGTRYVYKVRVIKPAKEMKADTIESPSDEAKLTLYTHDFDGVVVVAEPSGTVAWTSGKPFIKKLGDVD